MDGIQAEHIPHSFEPGKAPDRYATLSGALRHRERQFVLLWDYILNVLKPDTNFYNLGEGVEYNLSTDISRKEFPLDRLRVV